MSILPRKFDIADSMPTPPAAPAPKPEPAPAAPPPPVNNWNKATPADKPPKLVRLHLAEWAEAEADDFRRVHGDGNCSCHTSPPCSSCTHPGNPLNLAEDDEAWVMGREPVIKPVEITVHLSRHE